MDHLTITFVLLIYLVLTVFKVENRVCLISLKTKLNITFRHLPTDLFQTLSDNRDDWTVPEAHSLTSSRKHCTDTQMYMHAHAYKSNKSEMTRMHTPSQSLVNQHISMWLVVFVQPADQLSPRYKSMNVCPDFSIRFFPICHALISSNLCHLYLFVLLWLLPRGRRSVESNTCRVIVSLSWSEWSLKWR